jgi:cytochrome c5
VNRHPVRLTAIASALLACTASAWAQSPEGKAIVDAQCNSCHALSARVGSGYTPEGW